MKIMTCAQTLGTECRKAGELCISKAPAELSSDKSIRDRNDIMEQETRHFDAAVRNMAENTRHLEELLSQTVSETKSAHRMVIREQDQ
jgi:hypothetical protein